MRVILATLGEKKNRVILATNLLWVILATSGSTKIVWVILTTITQTSVSCPLIMQILSGDFGQMGFAG